MQNGRIKRQSFAAMAGFALIVVNLRTDLFSPCWSKP
jgi:hypothetical protein